MKRILIVGGVAGGASAAARLRRLDEKAEIVIFERGEYVSFANCGLPYYAGGVIGERDKLLVQTPKSLKDRLNLDVRTKTDVVSIDTEQQKVTVRNEAGTSEEPYDILVLSPGAAPFVPNLPGVDDARIHTVRSIPDIDGIKKRLDEGNVKNAVVVGGGFIGIEMVENLTEAGVQVELVELMPQVLPSMLDPDMAAIIHNHFRDKGVGLHLGQAVKGFQPGEELQVALDNGDTLPADMVIMSVGVRPEVALAKSAGLELGPCGGIAVNEYLQTSNPHVYAVGDAIEVTCIPTEAQAVIPLAGPANKQGRLVADNISGRKRAYKGTQGTAIVKAMSLVAAGTGATSAVLDRAGITYKTSVTHSFPHATYYPGGERMAIKLLFSPEGRVLGAQIIGTEGVDKRIDVLATALRFGSTVEQLQELELAYAPPFSSAKDPVNIAGYVADNILKGDVATIQATEVSEYMEKATFVDVRAEAQHLTGSIDGSLNIPLDSLRARVNELPNNKPLVVYCQVGHQAYVACRVLMQLGFDNVINLAGGWSSYSPLMKEESSRVDATVQREVAATAAMQSIADRDCSCDGEAADGCCGKHKATSHTLDAKGLACPGPIARVHEKVKEMAAGDDLEVVASDPGFANDIQAWCDSTGNKLLSCDVEDGLVTVRLRKGQAKAKTGNATSLADHPHDKTIVVFSGDLDKVLASFVIATGAAAMNRKVTLFFTFWGLNALRKNEPVNVRKSLLDKMFGFMMPRGSRKLGLSRMQMGGVGPAMIRKVMEAKGISSLEDLMEQAKRAGIRMVACQMSMDVMGIKKEELIDGVEVGGVASYLSASETADTTLFV